MGFDAGHPIVVQVFAVRGADKGVVDQHIPITVVFARPAEVILLKVDGLRGRAARIAAKDQHLPRLMRLIELAISLLSLLNVDHAVRLSK